MGNNRYTLTRYYTYTTYYGFCTSPVIRDGGREVLKLSVRIVHVIHSVSHGVVVEHRGSVCLVVDLIVVVPPAATSHAPIAIISTSMIQPIAPAIVLTPTIVMLVTIASSSLLTLMSLPPKCRRRGCGLRFVNTRLPQLLLQVRLLPRDPLPGLPLRVEVALIHLDLVKAFHLSFTVTQ